MRNRSIVPALLCLVMLAGCTSTVAGRATKASPGGDDAVVALMDTGDYSTTPNPPLANAGKDGAAFEGRRMAEYVTGPWHVAAELRDRVAVLGLHSTGPLWNADRLSEIFVDPVPDIAIAHGFITGFSSMRVRANSPGSNLKATSLDNVVLRFPADDAAAATVDEIAKLPSSVSSDPVQIPDHPETLALGSRLDGDVVSVQSFTQHGPYVLYQEARADPGDVNPYLSAALLTTSVLRDQERLIDGFVPTDPAKLADLPRDPSGRLLSRTLTAPDGNIPGYGIGVWPPGGWLHFAADPIEAEAMVKDVGVEWVSQLLATVYQTKSRQGAAKIVDKLTDEMAGTPNVRPVRNPVPGLPGARCFERTTGFSPPTESQTAQLVLWHFRCAAQADRYAFATYAYTEKDVMQRISAQYRMLAGE